MTLVEIDALMPNQNDLTVGMIQRWIAAAVAQAAALREHNAWLFSEERLIADRLRQAWRDWIKEAESLLNRAAVLPAEERETIGESELRQILGEVGSMLLFTPEMIAQRREQVRRGEVRAFEEVRRELRAANRR